MLMYKDVSAAPFEKLSSLQPHRYTSCKSSFSYFGAKHYLRPESLTSKRIHCRSEAQKQVRNFPRQGPKIQAASPRIVFSGNVEISKMSSEAPAPGKTLGIVIVDHGSRKKESHNQLVDFVELFKSTTQIFEDATSENRGPRNSIVELAHMEIMEPTIEQAINACVSRGANFIVVAPYFLSNGRHVLHDVPNLVKEAEAKLNGRAHCVVAPAIGVDELMVQLIQKRIREALESQEAENLA